MGNLYRFVEPVVLFLLSKKGCSYGYDLSGDLQRHALTDAEIERAALYRVLRQLETNGNVTSEWEVEKGGPARRVYKLTPKGREHLDEWATVLGHLSLSMARFVRQVKELEAPDAASPRAGVPGRAPRGRAAGKARARRRG
jgi:DNA-binding PadR family transcriptional regulator